MLDNNKYLVAILDLMKSLVTGGAGFIGSHIVDALIERGEEVVVVDNLSNGRKANLNPHARFIQQSITDPLDELFNNEKFDYVFHLAAQANIRRSIVDPAEDTFTNVYGSINIFQACSKYNIKKIVVSSTGGAIYSPKAPLPCNERSACEPLSPYGLAKKTAEQYLELLSHLNPLPFVILRYSNVYGPRQNAKGEAGVIAIFADSISKGAPIRIFGDGNQTRDFVFVGDVVKANLLARNLSGTFNVATGIGTSVNQLAELLMRLSNKKTVIEHLPAIPGELFHYRLDAQSLKKEGWKVEYPLETGLKKTLSSILVL